MTYKVCTYFLVGKAVIQFPLSDYLGENNFDPATKLVWLV